MLGNFITLPDREYNLTIAHNNQTLWSYSIFTTRNHKKKKNNIEFDWPKKSEMTNLQLIALLNRLYIISLRQKAAIVGC